MAAKKPAPGKVFVTLSAHLDKKYADKHGLEKKHYGPGAQVEVTPAAARAIIGAGYAARIDPTEPEAPEAVESATTPDRPAPDTAHPTDTAAVAGGTGGAGAGKK